MKFVLWFSGVVRRVVDGVNGALTTLTEDERTTLSIHHSRVMGIEY